MAAGATVASSEEAAQLVDLSSGVKVSARHLQTLCREIGNELAETHRRRTQAYRARPLMSEPRVAEPPVQLAAVMVDGGRMQTRTPDCGPGVHDPAWREPKCASLLRMTHVEYDDDPQHGLPACFTRPISKKQETETETPKKSGSNTRKRKKPDEQRATPRVLFRTGLATLENSESFGWMTAAAAEERGFFSAQARAFVADGQAYNWSIHRQHFSDFEPILDFMHAAEHVHEAAAVCDDQELGRRWVEMCWQGRVREVLLELKKQADERRASDEPTADPEAPWCAIERVCNYLNNNCERMDYPRYRRAGLPITSSHVESWIKQVNRRVKGSEKFWNNNQNAESILQLRAAWLGDDQELAQHLKKRRGRPTAPQIMHSTINQAA